MLGIVKIVGGLKKANGTANAQEEEKKEEKEKEEVVEEVQKEVWEEEEKEKVKIPKSRLAVKAVRDQLEKMKIEMLQVPRHVKVDNIAECYDVIARLGQSIVRAKTIVKICESAMELGEEDLTPIDRTYLEYYRESAKIHIKNAVSSAQKFVESLKEYYEEDSFELKSIKALVDELGKLAE